MHTAQLMPLPVTVSRFSKIQIGFTFLAPAHPGSPGQRAVKWVCVCVCVCCFSPESIRNRNDVFYLMPEPSCVPDSPVWYSAQPLSTDAMNRMLSRIRVVREIQETQLNQAPAGTPAAIAATVFG